MTALDSIYVESVVRAALEEDLGSGDITTLLIIPEDCLAHARMTARQEGIIAGMSVARAVFAVLDPRLDFAVVVADGGRALAGEVVAEVRGPARGILAGERVALNFVQRMSGIAALTARCVERVAHTKARIADTRKTTPGLRRLEKYAVGIGGGVNHRFGLSDGVLIKDNHIAVTGGVTAAVTAARRQAPHYLRIEVEVSTLSQLDEAIAAGADVVMLDNMDIEAMRQAVEVAAGRVTLEASGGANVDTVAAIAETGVDVISIGALTHSAPAMDISLDFEPQ